MDEWFNRQFQASQIWKPLRFQSHLAQFIEEIFDSDLVERICGCRVLAYIWVEIVLSASPRVRLRSLIKSNQAKVVSFRNSLCSRLSVELFFPRWHRRFCHLVVVVLYSLVIHLLWKILLSVCFVELVDDVVCFKPTHANFFRSSIYLVSRSTNCMLCVWPVIMLNSAI